MTNDLICVTIILIGMLFLVVQMFSAQFSVLFALPSAREIIETIVEACKKIAKKNK